MTTPVQTRIRTASKFFFEGDRKFFIKGATYGPFKPDENGDQFGRPE
jgi:O-antigen biosynthesis protein